MKNKQAFTLIELLVVVLIIGILATVAVPQYQKAVMKASSMRLLPLIKAIDTAEQIYFLANGTYTITLDELDISLPGGAKISNTTSATYEDFVCSMGLRANKSRVSLYCYNTDKKAPMFEKYPDFPHFLCWGNNGKLAQEICKSVCGVGELDDMGNGYIGCTF